MKRALFGILVAGFSCLSNIQATRMDALVTGSPTFPHPNVMTATQLPQTVFPGTKSQWEGCDRYDFKFQDRDAIVVVPKKAAPGRPWIWRPAFFGAFPSVDQALLKEGFHIVYYDLTHLYGSPHGVKLGNDFYAEMVNHYQLASKVTVEGFSRGGLYAFHWAAQNPEKVACLYVDAPVCNVFSWPKKTAPDLWPDLLKEWNLKDEEVGEDFQGNVIHLVDKLVAGKVPVMAVCGGVDKVVPYEENLKPVADKYRKAGGVIEVIVKPDCDHHPHSLENPEPVVDFIKRYQPGYADKVHIQARNNLNNAFHKFNIEKKGCVAFLGGSITEMRGWCAQIREDLQQRFPDTQFTFIKAGLPSAGSTPHAFRMEQDVLQHGTPDLMFVEAAVNDDTNYFTGEEQIQGMEGIVRHALRVNPKMDIIFLHFIYDPFIEPLQQGEQPEVFTNHEKVAEHYQLPSIHLAQEVAERMKAGEFDWNQFGGTHPSWFGHKYYTAAINLLLDQETKPFDALQEQKHSLPTPLNPFSYADGKLVPISEAKKLKGFEIVNDWTPDDPQIATRPGFVHVPMLHASQGKSSLTFSFTGTAVGIFCAAGPKACVLEYSIDGAPYKKIDTYTEWSSGLYIPWVYMFEKKLENKSHTLKLRIPKGERTECVIRNFVVNQPE